MPTEQPAQHFRAAQSPPWPPIVPAPGRSAAVLIGTATQVVPSTLPQLPQAAAGVTALTAELTGPYGLFDPSTVHSRIDPPTPAEVLRLLPAPGGERLDLLLFSFSGHGVRGPGDRLCLALPGTVDDGNSAEHTALPVATVFQALESVRARHKVVVLDCCFAGRALDAPEAADVHLLAAAGRTKRARTPEGYPQTGFTATLLRLLAEGVPDGPEHLDLTTLHRHLDVALPAAGLPRPLQRAFGDSGDVALFRNRAHGTAGTRPGLLARARFAERLKATAATGGRRRLRHAAALFAAIASDAAAHLGPTDPDTLRYRHAHASATGAAGEPQRAHALLRETVAAWEPTVPPDDPGLAAARASLDVWRDRAGATSPSPTAVETGT
ncbi:caspase family protein [Streptomyces sp. BHT-5-2]|uniref:caspase family protein n=1 Tax=unclassified Streptomyces TaxID=2593676 RepID=UPI001C8E048C|nr:caspase family protein [Streptomyces sp. BHT-5-2]QZL05208.1 caspase family protein [Streptomyces sp. BHT-5-2]